MCCARCGRTAISTRRRLRQKRRRPLQTVQNGDYPAFKRKPAAARLFHRRNPPPAVGELRRGGVLRRRPDDPRHGRPGHAGSWRRARCRRRWKSYDRGQGVWRGTGKVLPAEVLGSEADWRPALAAVPDLPRDVEGLASRRWCWRSARATPASASRASRKTTDGHFIPAEDVTWARKRGEDGKLGHKAKVAVRSGRCGRCRHGARGHGRGWQLRALVAASGARGRRAASWRWT